MRDERGRGKGWGLPRNSLQQMKIPRIFAFAVSFGFCGCQSLFTWLSRVIYGLQIFPSSPSLSLSILFSIFLQFSYFFVIVFVCSLLACCQKGNMCGEIAHFYSHHKVLNYECDNECQCECESWMLVVNVSACSSLHYPLLPPLTNCTPFFRHQFLIHNENYRIFPPTSLTSSLSGSLIGRSSRFVGNLITLLRLDPLAN